MIITTGEDMTPEHYEFTNRSWAAYIRILLQKETPAIFAEWSEGGVYYRSAAVLPDPNSLTKMRRRDWTLGLDEPCPDGCPHDTWVEYERKCQAQAQRYDVV